MMKVTELIAYLEGMDKNKDVEIYDDKIDNWRKITKDDIEEAPDSVTIYTG